MEALNIEENPSEFTQNERCVNTESIPNEEIKRDKPSDKCFDKGHSEALLSSSKILVTETNVPSSQAQKNFSLKLMQIKARLESGVK